MARKYEYYGKRGVTIIGGSDGAIGKSNDRSYHSTAYGTVSRKIGTNRMRASKVPRGQAGIRKLQRMSQGARVHKFYAFTKRVEHMTDRGDDYGHRTMIVRDPIRKRVSTGHSGE